jgi:hypothetical protein
MRNFGKKSLDEIKERLAARGLIEAPVRDETIAAAEEPIVTEEESETGETGEPETSISDGEEGV